MGKRIFLLFLALFALSSCTLFKGDKKKCHKPQEYQQAEVGRRVEIPEGLEQLDPSVRLDVPEGERMTEPLPRNEPCLTEPPRYSE